MENTKLVGQLYRMENALADPEVRKSAQAMGAILHADFMEIGASGKIFGRTTVLEFLAKEDDFTAYSITDFAVIPLGDDRALVTFRIPARQSGQNTKPGSHRSSLWVKEGGTWQIRFHQGTRYP